MQVGTEKKPHCHKATITMHGNVLTKELPVYGNKNIAVRNGTLDLHGIRNYASLGNHSFMDFRLCHTFQL